MQGKECLEGTFEVNGTVTLRETESRKIAGAKSSTPQCVLREMVHVGFAQTCWAHGVFRRVQGSLHWR